MKKFAAVLITAFVLSILITSPPPEHASYWSLVNITGIIVVLVNLGVLIYLILNGDNLYHKVPERSSPDCWVGEVVRYGTGMTDLMKVDSISHSVSGSDDHFFYGIDILGNACVKLTGRCEAATPDDMEVWKVHASPKFL